MRVWKYSFKIEHGAQRCTIPKNGKILSVHMQGKLLCAWVLVDPQGRAENRTFFVCATGEDIEPGLKFLGTAVDGAYVWHLFEQLV